MFDQIILHLACSVFNSNVIHVGVVCEQVSGVCGGDVGCVFAKSHWWDAGVVQR